MPLLVLSIAASLLGCVPQARSPGPLRVVSPNGRFAAEAVPQASSAERGPGAVRCDLTVYELRPGGERAVQWKGLYDDRGLEAGHFLADDGSAFVNVDPRYSEAWPLVRALRKGLVLAALDARALSLRDPRPARPLAEDPSTTFRGAPAARPGTSAAEPGLPWIDLGPQSARLRDVASVTNTSRFLDLLGRDGILRTLDLSNGTLVVSSDPGLADAPRIERELAREATSGLEPLFVQTTSAPRAAFSDEALAIDIVGSFPTPGWELRGFVLEPDARAAERWVISPLARPPSGIVTQVLQPFRATAKVAGWRIGTYAIAVRGRDLSTPPADLRVTLLPRGLVALTRRSDGRSSRTLALLADGRCLELGEHATPARTVLAPPARVEDIQRRVRDLDPRWASSPSASAAQSQSAQPAPSAQAGGMLEVAWIASQKPVVVMRDETALEAPLRELASALEALMRPGPVRHAIDTAASRLSVHTSSAGLLAAFGHDHTIATRGLEGYIDLTPLDLEQAEVEITLRADSLEVVDEGSQKDRPEIEKEMRDSVLRTARHPRIYFKSKRVSAKPFGPRTHDVTITGDLELCGVKREITIRGRIGLDEGEIQARGEFSLRQSEFGIRPTSALGGTVKVDDALKLEFDVRARRAR